MANKVFIITGHGAGDPGACGNGYQEYERVRTLAKRCKAFGGDNVKVSKENRNYYKDNGISNMTLSKDWLIVEFHMDSASASAKGAHVIINAKYDADQYDKALASFLTGILPGRSRSIVGRSDLANVNRAAKKGYNYRLIEIGFISNAGDVKIFNSKMDEIAVGILKAMGVPVSNSAPAPSTPSNTNSKLYRVRKSWSDASSQLGAYADLDNAKKKCDENEGYSVFDWNGKAVYTNKPEAVTKALYRVRKSWSDASSQLGAYADLDNAKKKCDENPGYSVFDEDGKSVYTVADSKTEEEAEKEPVVNKPEAPEPEDISVLKGLSKDEFIEYIGALARTDMGKTGVLASVTIAQAILESGWGQSELSLKANNLFGMKASLSGNTWGSEWDGKIYAKWSNEEVNGVTSQYYSDFRAYDTVSESIKDHSAYLCGAKKGTALRYEGLAGETDYRTAIQIIKDGGYATDSGYVDKICNIIETYNLTEFDKEDEPPVELDDMKESIAEMNKVLSAIFTIVTGIFNAFKSIFKVGE